MYVKQCLPFNSVSVCRVYTSVTRTCRLGDTVHLASTLVLGQGQSQKLGHLGSFVIDLLYSAPFHRALHDAPLSPKVKG